MLLSCEGEVTLQGPNGQRTVAAADLFLDYLTTSIEPGEVLTEVRVAALDGYGHGYQKFNRRSEDWAMVAVNAVVKASGGVCEDVRVGMTNMASVPLRATAVEEALRGQELTRGEHRERGGARGRRHKSARRPQRERRLQASPRAGADQARAARRPPARAENSLGLT